MIAQLHFAEHALALHFFLECAERLIDVVVANKNLYQGRSPSSVADRFAAKYARRPRPKPSAAAKRGICPKLLEKARATEGLASSVRAV